jgi:hypothetical protein
LTAAAAVFNSCSAASWYARPNTVPAASKPVWAPDPAVNTALIAAPDSECGLD